LNCRHCGKPFDPLPGKPGYVDECPGCLWEKSAAQILTKPRKQLDEKEISKMAKWVLRQNARISESKARLLAELLLSAPEMTEQELRVACELIRSAKPK